MSKPSSNLTHALKLTFWLLAVLTFLLLVVAPLLTTFLIKAGQMPIKYVKMLRHAETAQFYLMQVFGVIWIFFLGSCFASFLNVVAWRTPRGRGINGSSKCPFCNNKLRFWDNLPVVGWLRNGGQCRDCRLPISLRYLIVEIILGSLFLLVCGIEILGGGWNLPFRMPEKTLGFENLVFEPKWDLIQLASYHLCLICLLFTFSLIRSEGLKVPIQILVTGLIIGLVLPFIWPAMLIASWQFDVSRLVEMPRFSTNQFLTLIMGTVVGLIGGVWISWISKPEAIALESESKISQDRFVPDGIASLALVGLFLGWQSAISVSVLASLLGLIGKPTRNFNLSVKILLATMLHLILWRITTSIQFWPSQASSWIEIAIALVAILILGTAIRIRSATEVVSLGER